MNDNLNTETDKKVSSAKKQPTESVVTDTTAPSKEANVQANVDGATTPTDGSAIGAGNDTEIKIRRAKGSKNVTTGVCHVLATFNNTKVTFTDTKGSVLSWSSSGRCGFKGSRKSTAYAAQVVTTEAGKVAMGHGLKEVSVNVKGPGMGRDAAIRTLQTLGLGVLAIKDVTPVPHNGCRPPKRRRV